MKTLSVSKLVTAALLSATLTSVGFAEERAGIQIGVQTGVSFSNHSVIDQDHALIVGNVTLSHQGEIKIKWDGLSVNAGSLTVLHSNERAAMSGMLPTVSLDLQKLLGVQWMRSMRLQVGTGSINNDFLTGRRDISLGQITVNLAQTLVESKRVRLTLAETAGVTGYFKREILGTDKTFEAVPVNFALNTELVAHLSEHVVASVSLGAFAAIVNGIDQNAGFRSIVYGVNAKASLLFSDSFEMGAIATRSETTVVTVDGLPQRDTLNVTGYVKYKFSSTRRLQARQAIELNMTLLKDQSLGVDPAHPFRAITTGLKYSVIF